MKKAQLVKIGRELADEYEKEIDRTHYREDDDEFYARQDARMIRYLANQLAEPNEADAPEEPSSDAAPDYPPGYPQAETIHVRMYWFRQHFYKFQNCGFCPELPDEPANSAEPEAPPVPEPPPVEEAEKTAAKPDPLAILKVSRDVAIRLPEPPADLKKWELIKFGRALAADLEWEAEKYDYKDDRNFWGLQDAKAVTDKVNELFQSLNSDELEKHLKSSAPPLTAAPPSSASLAERSRWFLEQCQTLDKCSFCGALPDDLTVKSGLDERFPEAFYGLAVAGDEYPQYSPFRRCPKCGTYFQWIDMPEMYGSGNNDQERLVRLSKPASRLLDEIFSADPKAPTSLYDITNEFESIPLDVLLLALDAHVLTKPEIVAPFVPFLLNVVVRNDQSMRENVWRVRDLLLTYVKYKTGKADEVLKAFGALTQYPMTEILRQCLEMTERKK